ncbi:hypothetical protein [uncultured Methanobrevibacter sp.]|uniref:hypothetical protein n=1 Tax=uncultured Methanobrevibacter sp. TaxID=253161 RepID=UPI0025E13C1B|nr:hypothetical protein [uncultured Methanobrevibacter sp.]
MKEFIKIILTDLNLKIDEDSKIEILTEEQITIKPSLHRPDFIARVNDIILMLEFQSTAVRTKDKKRFKEYSKFVKYKINDWDVFIFPIISLLNFDEREIISNIKQKIIKQENFTDSELIELALTPIMVQGRKNIIHQFEETATLMNQISYRTQTIKESVYGIALMLGNMYFTKGDPMRKKIQGDFMMKVDCVTEAIQENYNAGKTEGKIEGKKEGKIEGKIEGKKEGKKEGKIEIIKDLLNEGELTTESTINKLNSLNCDLKTISEITGLSENEIKKIISAT